LKNEFNIKYNNLKYIIELQKYRQFDKKKKKKSVKRDNKIFNQPLRYMFDLSICSIEHKILLSKKNINSIKENQSTLKSIN